ncbi:MAG: amino acid--tRNA ligase-related protein [Candidatus Nanoperiomorbaceae bacterium]
MATLADFRDERIKKLNELRRLGVNPYPASVAHTAKINDITTNFTKFDGSEQTLVGRIVSLRKFGKLAFVVIRDMSGQIQLVLTRGVVEEIFSKKAAGQREIPTDSDKLAKLRDSQIGMGELSLLDTGDFIEASGHIGKTQTGEMSLMVRKLRILTKSLRPMPDRQGFTNKEERLRRRYIDMNVNQEVRECFIRRSKFWAATRQFLVDRGFIEINVPVLEHTTGGADATPFKTHMDALDEDFYLRISHELPLKRLIGAGFERVFDIGPRFRNEGVDDEHLPEHIAMESYAAFQDYHDGMDLYEEMIKYVAQQTWGKLQFSRDGMNVDLDQTWPRRTFADLLHDELGVDVFMDDTEANREHLRAVLRQHNVVFDDKASLPHLLDSCWKIIRRRSAGPFWLIHEPVSVSPLAKKHATDPRVTERFHPIILGTEMGNGFSELNDPLDQLDRFVAQQKMRDNGDKEAMMLDIDFVEMLEYGMPPTCGWGNSERNFWLFEGVSAREGVPFPAMKSEISETTRKIYQNVKLG